MGRTCSSSIATCRWCLNRTNSKHNVSSFIPETLRTKSGWATPPGKRKTARSPSCLLGSSTRAERGTFFKQDRGLSTAVKQGPRIFTIDHGRRPLRQSSKRSFIPAPRESSRTFSLPLGTEVTALVRLSCPPGRLVGLMNRLVQKLSRLQQQFLLLRRHRLGCLLLPIRLHSPKLLLRDGRRGCKHALCRFAYHQVFRRHLRPTTYLNREPARQDRRGGLLKLLLCFRLRTPQAEAITRDPNQVQKYEDARVSLLLCLYVVSLRS